MFRGKAVGKATAKVTATDDKGMSTPMTFVVNVNDGSGVSDINADGSRLVIVKENPVDETLVMSVVSGGSLNVEIFDAAGKSVYHDSVDAVAGEEINVNMGGNTLFRSFLIPMSLKHTASSKSDNPHTVGVSIRLLLP